MKVISPLHPYTGRVRVAGGLDVVLVFTWLAMCIVVEEGGMRERERKNKGEEG